MTNALVSLRDIVKTFLFKYKLSDEDYFLYTEHAYDLVRNINLYHGATFAFDKLTTDSIGSASLPDDLVREIRVYTEYEGRDWTFTKKDDMFIRDLTAEPEYVSDQIYGLGGRGSINPYYYRIDWSNRKIYIDGLGAGADFYIDYMAKGISSDMLLDDAVRSVLDAYLRWKYAEINNMSPTERRERERLYREEILMYRRLNIPSIEEMQDTFRSLYSQVIQR